MSEAHDAVEPPDVSSWLLSFLGTRRDEYEVQYADAETDEDRLFHDALKQLESKAADLVTTGTIPSGLAESLSGFMPGDGAEAKVRELLTYRIVHHRLEFDVAEDVCERLSGVDKRVSNATIFTILLLGYSPAPTALKYFQRATKLYLAGYDTETIIMCGAVLEAALSHRWSDELLRNEGIKPLFKRTGGYAVSQRLRYIEERGVMSTEAQALMGQLINWRNDAVHVQPDIGPGAQEALVNLALLLPKILRAEDSPGAT